MLEVGRANSGRRISDIRGSGTRVELSRSNSGAGELEGRVEDWLGPAGFQAVALVDDLLALDLLGEVL